MTALLTGWDVKPGQYMGEPSMPRIPDLTFAKQVWVRLRQDDSILSLANTHYLNIRLSDGLCSSINSFREDEMSIQDWAEQQNPLKILDPLVTFLDHLRNYAKQLSDAPFSLDPRNPEGFCRFKMNDDIILAFHGDIPVWFWEKTNGIWKLNKINVLKRFDKSASSDIHMLLEGMAEIENDEGKNDPECLSLDALIGVIRYFIDVLEDAHKNLEAMPYIYNTTCPDSNCRFRSNDENIVAYRCIHNGNYQPIWCWRKKKDGSWKLYRMRYSVRSDMKMANRRYELPLTNGTW